MAQDMTATLRASEQRGTLVVDIARTQNGVMSSYYNESVYVCKVTSCQ